MRWGSPSEKATGGYADSTKAPFLPGFAFLRRGRRCAFPEGCAHCASPWVCSGASWVCSRFAKEVAPPFPCRTARDAPAVCVRLGRRSQTWNPLFGRGQPKVRGGQDSRRSTGNRGESSPSSEGSAASSPIQANDSAVSADVTVSVEPTVGSTAVTFKYKLTNDSAQTVWAVHSPAVSVMPASGRKTGVVAAMAFFPVRKDVSCVQPPYEAVVKLEPKQTVEGLASVQKPFKPYGDVEGGERVVFLFRLMGVWLWMGCVVAGGFPVGWLGGVFWAGGGGSRCWPFRLWESLAVVGVV